MATPTSPTPKSPNATPTSALAPVTGTGTSPTTTNTNITTTTYAPPPSAPPPALTTQTQTHQPAADPKVAELQLIFPTVEVSVIELVLETCGGSTDRAIEQLLGMTDPNFKPDELSGTREDTQVDLDAEFARSLQLQDEQEYQHQRQQPQGDGQLPYQPRVRRARPPPPGQAQQPDAFYQPQGREQQQGQLQGESPPGMLMMEEKIERFAEVGKQTFNSLLSKAKAKYSEYQATQATPTAGRGDSSTSQYGGGGWRGDDYGRGGAPGGNRGGEQNRPGQRGGLWGDVGSNSPSLTNSPSVRSESFSSQSTLDPPSLAQAAPLRTSSNRWQPSDTYDDPLPPRGATGASPSNRIEIGGGRRSPGVGSPDKGLGKIDPAKLGILPKKRVDLMSTSPASAAPIHKDSLGANAGDDDNEDPNPSLPSAPQSLVSKIPPTPPAGRGSYSLGDSDDELEYTKNPFDEK
ncbi:hypothetical protein CI109_100735 [Kwoniella shandongensis]|uniref:CUE domain-containing protein n=1 Tax=Kwoniella shandongensis TaxID=1734106 RepID=A0A5M6BTF3_9TREE|nr:uncharacterized protein CI109_007402 [Kwoniella shandongensis]KAA5524279.1 hypothetical protein CI109_007402 [Kwoniella shandongensis]